MKRNFVAELIIGHRITDFFVVRKKELRHYDGKPYLKLELGDRTGRVGAVLWEGAVEIHQKIAEGEVAKVRGVVEEYRGGQQLNVEKLRRATEDEYSLADYLPVGEHDPQELFARYRKFAQSIQNHHLQRLLASFIDDEEFTGTFISAPGGKLWHHAYLGGLLDHTLGVTSLCHQAAKIYSRVDEELLLSGALLHDVGKIQELKATTFIDYTDEGRLWGHIAIGYHMVRGKIATLEEFPAELAKKLLHLILSHHGELEFGSPVVPQTVEAIILYYADELDAKVGAFTRIIRGQKRPHRRWSQWVTLIDRFVYFGPEEKNLDSSEPQENL